MGRPKVFSGRIGRLHSCTFSAVFLREYVCVFSLLEARVIVSTGAYSGITRGSHELRRRLLVL